jgi:hypothetical protein
MTVSSTSPRIKYDCNGSTTDFTFTFNASATDEISVILTTSAGVETTLTENSHYFVTATNNDYTAGGTVSTCVTGDITTPYAWATGYTLTIMRVVDITQETDLVPQPTLYQTLEDALDKCARIDQQLQEQLDRTPKLKDSSETTGLTFPEIEAGKIIGYNAGGTDLTTYSTSSATTVDISTLERISDYSNNIATAITAIGASEKTLLIDVATAGDTTVPSNVNLWFLRGGSLSGTVTIDNPRNITAGLYQIFTNSATITFSNGGGVFPEWWGVNTTPGTTDMITAINASIASIVAAGGNIIFSPKIYATSTSITFSANSPVTLKGMGNYGTTMGTTVKWIGGNSDSIVDMMSYVNIEDMYIYNSNSSTALVGIDCIGASSPSIARNILKNVHVKSCAYGISFNYAWYDSLYDCTFSYNDCGIYMGQEANNIDFWNCHIDNNAIGIEKGTTGNSSQILFSGGSIENSSAYGIKITADPDTAETRGWIFDNVYFEDNYQHLLKDRIWIRNCFVDSDGDAGTRPPFDVAQSRDIEIQVNTTNDITQLVTFSGAVTDYYANSILIRDPYNDDAVAASLFKSDLIPAGKFKTEQFATLETEWVDASGAFERVLIAINEGWATRGKYLIDAYIVVDTEVAVTASSFTVTMGYDAGFDNKVVHEFTSNVAVGATRLSFASESAQIIYSASYTYKVTGTAETSGRYKLVFMFV